MAARIIVIGTPFRLKICIEGYKNKTYIKSAQRALYIIGFTLPMPNMMLIGIVVIAPKILLKHKIDKICQVFSAIFTPIQRAKIVLENIAIDNSIGIRIKLNSLLDLT